MSTTPTHIARYTVVQPIAAGGMGEVFLARDDRLDRLVAIKLLRDGFDDEELRGRFEEEARNVAKLTHPNIVTIYEYGAHDGRPYIAMEYVAGHSLADLIRGKMPLPLARRVRLIEELCSGLSHAHKAHLVHRDVKPANLMVTTSGMLKVLDFGIAKLRGSDRTQKGMLVGTVNYMSPEQITGQPVDHRSDIFAVGLVLHEVLTYDQAFKGDLTAAMFNIVHGQPEALAVRCPGLDPGFQAVVNRCLAKRPEDRYHDLNLLKRDLARLRKPLEDDDVELADTIGLLEGARALVVPPAPSTSATVAKAVGPDTRRALASAVAAGEAAIARGQFESAVRHAEQALALEADDAAARDLLERARRAIEAAKVASQLGHARRALQGDRLDDARTALMTAAQLAPGSDTVRDLAAQVEARGADLARFTETVREARAHLGDGDFARARSLAETAVRIRPDDSDLQRLRSQIDQAADAEVRRIADEAAREAERRAQDQRRDEVERVEQLERERLEREHAERERVRAEAETAAKAESERVARELRVETERLAETQRQAELARVVQEQRQAEGEQAERLERERRQAEADAEAEAIARDAVQAAERAASADLADAELDTNRAAETVIERVYWDEPTQSVQVLDTRTPTSAPSPPWAPAAARETQTEPTPSPPVAPLPMHPAATTRRILVPLGGAAAVTIALLVWAMRPATTPTPTTDASAVSTPSDAGEIAAEPLLTATPRGDAGALAEFQSPLPNRPAGTAPAPAVVPGTGGTTRPVPGPAPVTAVVTPVGSANTGPRPNVPPTAPPLVPPSKTPPLTPSVTPPNPGGSATPSGTGGPGATGAATPAVIPPPPPPTPVSPASGTTTNPGAVVPVGGITAAPAGGAPASRQLDETTIQRLVSAFGQAYQSKDLQALKAVWPEMRGGDENSYRNVFNSYRTINWVTGDTNIRFDGERADARAAVQVTQRALRPDTTTTQSRTYRFQFERRAKGWVLTGVENLGAAR